MTPGFDNITIFSYLDDSSPPRNDLIITAAAIHKSSVGMNQSPKLLLFIFLLYSLCTTGLPADAQPNVHESSTTYEWPKDTLVRSKLDKWQDQKFGLLLHWGLYAVPGIIESWSICSEDWIDRDSTIAYEDYKKWYWGLQKDFNPTKFDPAKWATAAQDAGMKYVVFTTKHHDGFCMFNTKQTDFSIARGPFKNDPRADVAKAVFDAFRTKGFMIGAYFSKPDWHSPLYWWPKYATADRNNNYDITKFPWRWNAFKQYTYNQISELMHGYGSMDILWLDGGWVRPLETVNDEVRSWGHIPSWSQDIDMPRIAAMAREAQPGLLMVDRTVHGPFENYQTPEQKIPATQLDHPWESCLTLANNWGYVPNDTYKSSTSIIHTLIEVVAKGGSLLLGVGPKPDGTLSDTAVSRLEDIGRWTRVNGAALYNTRTTVPYQEGNIYFTRSKSANKINALVCLPADTVLPAVVRWSGHLPAKGSRMRLLQTGENVKWELTGSAVTVHLPAALTKIKQQIPALAFSFDEQSK